MNVVTILSIVAAAAFPFMGGYVLRADTGSCANRVFAVSALLMTYWSIFAALSISAPDAEQAFFWFRISSLGWTVIPGFMFRLFTEMTGHAERTWIRVVQVVIYMVGLAFFILTVFTTKQNTGMVQTPLGFSYLVAPGILPWLYDAFVTVCLVPVLVVLLIQGRRSLHPAVRARDFLVVGVSVVTLTLLYGADRLLHVLDLVRVPSLSHLIMMVWMVGIGVAVARYRLFSLTPELAAQNIVETMAESLLMLDGDERVIRVNSQAERLLDAPRHRLLGRRFQEVLGGGSVLELLEDASEVRDHEITITRGDRRRILSFSAAVVRDRYGQLSGHVVILRDVTHRKSRVEQLQHMATHDELTGLPNRRLLYDRFGQALARTRRYGGHLAVMMVDLDFFKEINDTLGHEAGDTVLATMARRLNKNVRDSDTVARLGGDEFVVLATDLPDPSLASTVVSRLVASLRSPMDLGGQERTVTTSIGIAVFPADGDSVDELLASADQALYLVKERGRDGHAYHREVVEGQGDG